MLFLWCLLAALSSSQASLLYRVTEEYGIGFSRTPNRKSLAIPNGKCRHSLTLKDIGCPYNTNTYRQYLPPDTLKVIVEDGNGLPKITMSEKLNVVIIDRAQRCEKNAYVTILYQCGLGMKPGRWMNPSRWMKPATEIKPVRQIKPVRGIKPVKSIEPAKGHPTQLSRDDFDQKEVQSVDQRYGLIDNENPKVQIETQMINSEIPISTILNGNNQQQSTIDSINLNTLANLPEQLNGGGTTVILNSGGQNLLNTLILLLLQLSNNNNSIDNEELQSILTDLLTQLGQNNYNQNWSSYDNNTLLKEVITLLTQLGTSSNSNGNSWNSNGNNWNSNSDSDQILQAVITKLSKYTNNNGSSNSFNNNDPFNLLTPTPVSINVFGQNTDPLNSLNLNANAK